jgi:hypothetical protein
MESEMGKMQDNKFFIFRALCKRAGVNHAPTIRSTKGIGIEGKEFSVVHSNPN